MPPNIAFIEHPSEASKNNVPFVVNKTINPFNMGHVASFNYAVGVAQYLATVNGQ